MSEEKADGKKKTHVLEAIRTGRPEELEQLLQEPGGEAAVREQSDEHDGSGHTAAHWACLGGHTAALRRLAALGFPLDDPGRDEQCSHPIHWACVNGHIAAVDVLLQLGVAIDVADAKGSTPLIVAAQHGHTALAGYLMGKGARLLLADKEGDTALHWAAFKGHSEVMRLLIYSGLNPKQKDNHGQTPLHLACISGNLTGVKELCEQDGVEIDIIDKNGKTPLALASGRRNADVTAYLKMRSRRGRSIVGRLDLWSVVFGPPGNSKGPLLFFLVAVLLYGYPTYLHKLLYITWEDLYVAHIVFWIVNAIMWVCLYHSSTIDPGYLPRNVPEYDMAIKQVAHCDEWGHGVENTPLSRLCHTCRTVRPQRSKHCGACGRCVAHFDHHCPYIHNCVGYENRVSFLGFAITASVNGLLSIAMSMYYMHYVEKWVMQWHYWPFGLYGIFLTGVATVIAAMTSLNALANITTNETKNMHRYKQFKLSKTEFRNPYHRGFKGNIMEYLHLIPPLSEAESLEHIKVV